jgi:hypothetical protein
MAKFSMADHVRKLLGEHGVESTAERPNGGHVKVRFQVGGKSRMYTCANSASDGRARLNAAADIRRILRGG